MECFLSTGISMFGRWRAAGQEKWKFTSIPRCLVKMVDEMKKNCISETRFYSCAVSVESRRRRNVTNLFNIHRHGTKTTTAGTTFRCKLNISELKYFCDDMCSLRLSSSGVFRKQLLNHILKAFGKLQQIYVFLQCWSLFHSLFPFSWVLIMLLLASIS